MPEQAAASGSVVTSLLGLAALTAALGGGFALLGVLFRLFTGQLRLPQLRPARRPCPDGDEALPLAGPPHRPVQSVAADLRRLAHELAVVPSGTPVARRRGLLAAYDDVLVEAAELLEVPHQLTTVPESGREVERLRLLASLEAAGLVVSG
ncbi:hypothetical protein [Modestobacter sp. URMC 112]